MPGMCHDGPRCNDHERIKENCQICAIFRYSAARTMLASSPVDPRCWDLTMTSELRMERDHSWRYTVARASSMGTVGFPLRSGILEGDRSARDFLGCLSYQLYRWIVWLKSIINVTGSLMEQLAPIAQLFSSDFRSPTVPGARAVNSPELWGRTPGRSTIPGPIHLIDACSAGAPGSPPTPGRHPDFACLRPAQSLLDATGTTK